MRRVLLLIILCAVFAGCAPAAAQAPTWSEEEAAYWQSVDEVVYFPVIPSATEGSKEGPVPLLYDPFPPSMAVLRELYSHAAMDCTFPERTAYCVESKRAVRLELARIVEEKGSYPAGYVHLGAEAP